MSRREKAAASIDETVLYLFGFVARPAGLVDDRQGNDVFLIEAGDVAVAASVVRARDYEPPRDGGVSDLDWVAPLAWRHHEVLRYLHSSGTVAPLKFGALCPDVDHARTLLRRLHDPIRALLNRFEGKDEWALNVCVDCDALTAAVRRGCPDLLELEQEASQRSSGAEYFARKRLQHRIVNVVSDQLAGLRECICERLSDLGLELAISGPGEGMTRAAMVPVAEGAALVDRCAWDALERSLAELEAAYAPVRLTCELRGPWPPYSFAGTLEVA